MADDREPYEPLWADALRRQPGRQPEEPAKPKPPRFPAGPALAIAALAMSAVLLGVIVNDPSSRRVTFANLPSYWGSVEMTCATWRIEAGDGTLEVFRCRPRGSGELPPGTYRPPGTNWNSDFDRRPAKDHAIRISASGEVVGWAHYRR